ncbi:MAG: hypothetical protein HY689_15130 [Chloroflexi bacterium]|nr:hypothetical protein [Chloroflexota bacterium]
MAVSGRSPLASIGEFAPVFALSGAVVYLALEWHYQVRYLGMTMLPIVLALLLDISPVPVEATPTVTLLLGTPPWWPR